jgi:hypothetical protein
MADGGVGHTATSHRMTKRTSQGVAQASRAPHGRRERAKFSPMAANRRWPCRAMVFAGGGEKSKYYWLGMPREERWNTMKRLARTHLAAWLKLRGGGAALAP